MAGLHVTESQCRHQYIYCPLHQRCLFLRRFQVGHLDRRGVADGLVATKDNVSPFPASQQITGSWHGGLSTRSVLYVHADFLPMLDETPGAKKFYSVHAKAGFGEVVSKPVLLGAAGSADKPVKRTATYW